MFHWVPSMRRSLCLRRWSYLKCESLAWCKNNNLRTPHRQSSSSSTTMTSSKITHKNFKSLSKSNEEIPDAKIKKSDDEWQEGLSEMEFYVTRKQGTERPWTGPLTFIEDEGVFACVCCGTELFKSDAKFESHCGWPSFHSPSEDDNVIFRSDKSLGTTRVEVICKTCHAHLGHVFDDAPKTETGLRYCINSASLRFHKKE